MTETKYQEALLDIRGKLKKKRGYAGRIVSKLFPKAKTEEEIEKKKRDVWNVAHGQAKDAKILKALIKEANAAEAHTDPCLDIINDYLKDKAA